MSQSTRQPINRISIKPTISPKKNVKHFLGERNWQPTNPTKSRKGGHRGLTVNSMYYGQPDPDEPYIINSPDILARFNSEHTRTNELGIFSALPKDMTNIRWSRVAWVDALMKTTMTLVASQPHATTNLVPNNVCITENPICVRGDLSLGDILNSPQYITPDELMSDSFKSDPQNCLYASYDTFLIDRLLHNESVIQKLKNKLQSAEKKSLLIINKLSALDETL